jgi:hypothetical protein
MRDKWNSWALLSQTRVDSIQEVFAKLTKGGGERS